MKSEQYFQINKYSNERNKYSEIFSQSDHLPNEIFSDKQKPVEINKYSSKEPVEIKKCIEGFDCKVPVR